jgi:hypothetical protein
MTQTKAIPLTAQKVAFMQENIRQVDAIFQLEGFEPTDQTRAIDAAVLAGRVTRAQVSDELVAYAKEHKSVEGFIASRSWT